MKPISSVTITPPKEAALSSGGPHGQRGVAIADASKAVAWLLARTPWEVDKAVEVLLVQRYDCWMATRIRQDFGVPQMTIAGAGSKVEALKFVQNAMLPAPDKIVLAALGECALLTVTKNRDDHLSEAVMKAYAARCRQHPADVVVSVLKNWPDSNKFFPTWNELHELCLDHGKKRRALENLLKYEIAQETKSAKNHA